jgi:hypothetical protein
MGCIESTSVRGGAAAHFAGFIVEVTLMIYVFVAPHTVMRLSLVLAMRDRRVAGRKYFSLYELRRILAIC